ncbi:citron rho-interacting kinase-like [Montipora capricornis]|uniref:citron rho-interacting kinase-like n=1 Tax=Montipora capricornis TaxID=246305 RepID=UPI0035F19D73
MDKTVEGADQDASAPQSAGNFNLEQCGRKLSLKDIRRYGKKTLPCPGGCGEELELRDIPDHDCIRELRKKLESAENSVSKGQSTDSETSIMENVYKEHLALQDRKIEQMSTEIKELLSERSRRDDIFNNKETFYKEQIAALRDQVAKLEKRLQLRRPSNHDDKAFEENDAVKEWALRYDKLLAEKITLETLFQRRERQCQREVEALKEEAAMLRESLHLEREMLSLEHDFTTFNKLASLTDQLETLVQHKHQQRGRRKHHKAKDLCKDTLMPNGKIQRRRVPNSVGSSNSESVDFEEDMDVEGISN